MNNLSPFCTCTDLECPMHPTNQERGFGPCIAQMEGRALLYLRAVH